MTWTITYKTNFLNTLLSLPSQVQKKFKSIEDILKNNPSNQYSLKIQGADNKLRRIKVTKQYRLFYIYGKGLVKLLSLVKRDKDTYDPIFLEKLSEEDIPTFFPSDEDAPEIEEQNYSQLLSEKQLEHWRIPTEYWSSLLNLKKDDEGQFEEKLLNLDISSIYIERIIDNLYPSSLDEIKNKPDLTLKEPEDLIKFTSGELELTEFLLKLSEEQEKLLNIESDVPILVKGGPGTGKSTLAVYRIQKLVKSGVKKILFTTHTDTLLNYYKPLLHTLLGELPEKLEIDTIDALAKRSYKKEYGEPNLATQEFSKFCLDSAINSVNLEPSLLKKINDLGEQYLIEEILIVIEARGIESLRQYREIERFGRKYPLSRQLRESIWSIYEKWKELISSAGLITIEQLRRKALEIAKQLTDKPYDAVIIDEAQDLSPIALKFLVQLASSHQGIYLTADVEQSLYQRSFSWNHLQVIVDFTGKTHTLRRSFRNTEEIGKACPEILGSTEVDEFSQLEGDKPRIVLTDDLLKQAQLIQDFFQDAAKRFHLPVYAGAILSPDSNYGKLIAQQLNFKGFPAEYVEQQNLKITKNCVKVLTLHSAKGLEFPFVAVVGLKEGILPRTTDLIPEDDKQEVLNQERRLFYVGCTRAMRSLLVCGSKSNPSQFIKTLMSSCYWQMEEI